MRTKIEYEKVEFLLSVWEGIIILNKDRITNKFDWENRTYLSTKS
jgi:hypothetical protein